MAWDEQWSIAVDGHELNTGPSGGRWFAEIPELGWMAEQEVILVPRDGDYPAAVGMQPQQAEYTLMVSMKAVSWSQWDTDLATLMGWLDYGAHAFVAQVRGMPSSKTFNAITKSLSTAPKYRRLTCGLVVPTPVLT